MIDGKNAMEALDSRKLVLKGRQLVINEAHSLSTQVERRPSRRTPRLDLTERLYVTGLSSSASEKSLRDLFQNHGLSPVDVYIVKDKQTGRPKGFGFVAMSSQSEAAQAIGALDGSLVEGRSITVKPAAPRPAYG